MTKVYLEPAEIERLEQAVSTSTDSNNAFKPIMGVSLGPVSDFRYLFLCF